MKETPRDNLQSSTKEVSSNFYGQVMSWLFTSFAISTATAYLIGPLLPPATAGLISIGLLVFIIATAFMKMSNTLSTVMIIVIPAAMGVMLYGIINSYVAAGAGAVVIQALVTTVAVMGGIAILAWRSQKTMYGLLPMLIVTLFIIIGVSIINVFLFHSTVLELIISGATALVFAVFTYIDIQAVRDKFYGDDIPASFYALQLYLDFINMFLAILRIFGAAAGK